LGLRWGVAVTREQAEKLAIQALVWLSGQEDLFPVFLGASGMNVDDLQESARDEAFLGAVLDFVLMDDSHIIAFCDGAGLSYDRPMAARQTLPGGAQVNWT